MGNNTNQWDSSIYKTWYEDSASVFFSAPTFEGREDCDTLIIGGGLAGLSLFSMLSDQKVDCILLEEKNIGSGASGINGGFCTPGWSVGQLDLENRVGHEKANLLYSISMTGFNWMENLCKKIHPNISQAKKGVLKAYYIEKKVELIRKLDEFNEKYSASIQFLKREQLFHHLRSPRYNCGSLDLQSFHFNPLNVMRSLATKAQIRTSKIFEGTGVENMERCSTGFKATTSGGGIVNAKRVVFCTGGDFSNIGLNSLDKKLFRLNTSIGVTEPLDKTFFEIISSDLAIHDDRRAGNYFRILPDNRLLWGRDIRAIKMPTKKEIIRGTKKDLKYFFPGKREFFEEMKFDYGWSGKLGYTSNFMPYIFTDKSDLYFLTGFGGHGMNAAPAAANIVKEAILGDNSKIQIFEDFSPSWNGGLLGKYAAEIYIRWLKFCDYLNRM